MKLIAFSDIVSVDISKDVRKYEIHIFSQFFIHQDKQRNKEITECLQSNINNIDIYKIHLLNERIYTDQEMGLQNSEKIVQTNISRRLRFKDVFEYIRLNSIKGYLIFVNIDIMFDSTVQNLKLSEIDEKKQMFALLRYEYNGVNFESSPLYGPRSDSQDTWIFHSNSIISHNQEEAFYFEFGKPGCDNKMAYIMKILGYEIINDPEFIKTYHYHRSAVRNYTYGDIVKQPWGFIIPANSDPTSMVPSLGINMNDVIKQDVWFDDNNIIREYIASKIERKENFIIPRISGIENNFAVFPLLYPNCNGNERQYIESYYKNVKYAMKNNAGIKLSNMESIQKYSNLYLDAFKNCEIFCGWDVQGNYLEHIRDTHYHLQRLHSSKKMIWSYALDIFHYIHSNPWTWALRGKRVLIISPFEDSIRQQIPIRTQLYDGIDLFPECEFITIKPPMTHGIEESLEFDEELKIFYYQLDKLKDSYDVALLSCGGYCNIISNYIFTQHKKSAIYVGGTLQMFFGILGKRWLIERPDVMRLYMNKSWTRATKNERPKGFEQIENGCYW